jgi:hypothetical protein
MRTQFEQRVPWVAGTTSASGLMCAWQAATTMCSPRTRRLCADRSPRSRCARPEEGARIQRTSISLIDYAVPIRRKHYPRLDHTLDGAIVRLNIAVRQVAPTPRALCVQHRKS